MSASLSGRLAALLAAMAVLLVLLLGWFVLVSPERSKADNLQGQVADTQLKLDASKAYVNDPANKHIEAELKRLQNLLPNDVRISQVLRQLSAASATAGVRLDTITPTAAVPGATTAEATPISLTVVGHYFALSKFLQLLNAKAQLKKDSVVGDGRLYSASSMTLSKGASSSSGTTTDPGLLTATITLNVYSYGTPAPTTPSDTSTSSTDTTTTP